MLTIALRAARKAGELIERALDRVDMMSVEAKGRNDFVTEIDRAAEKEIIYHLRKAYPEHSIRGEESGLNQGTDADYEWIVDPLDGTTNYLHGLPHWAISIALEHKGEVVAGVIFDAAKDEMFIAEKGAGAWMNQTRLRASGRSRMIESIFATGLPFGGRSDLPATLQDLARLLPATAGVRRFGSAALDLAYVAAGRYDGYWERRLNSWDIAAGLVIAKEAGAFVQPIDPAGNILEDGELIVANEQIFEKFAKVIRD